MPDEEKKLFIFPSEMHKDFFSKNCINTCPYGVCLFSIEKVTFQLFLNFFLQQNTKHPCWSSSTKQYTESGLSSTVEREIFANFVEIAKISCTGDANITKIQYSRRVAQLFLHTNCLWPKFAKLSCCKNVLFYSKSSHHYEVLIFRTVIYFLILYIISTSAPHALVKRCEVM